jgi:hypothetical protein
VISANFEVAAVTALFPVGALYLLGKGWGGTPE